MKTIPRLLLLILLAAWCGDVCLAEDSASFEPGGELETLREDELEDRLPSADPPKKNWFLKLDNTINYDSNPAVAPSDEEDDWADIFKLTAGKTFKKSGPHEIGGQYSFYGEFYSDQDERNIIGHTLDLYYGKMTTPLSFRIDYMYSRYELDNDVYLRKHGVAPLLFYAPGGRNIEMLRMSYSWNEYPSMEVLDGTDWSIQLRHFHFLDEAKKMRLSVSYKFASTDADDSDQSYISHQAGVGLTAPMAGGMTVTLGIDYSRKEYDGGREDNGMVYGIGFAKPINETWSVSLDYSSTDNSSDDPVADYIRNVVSFTMSASF
ncbi:surface lipoprotein assembly modifier [Planctomycetota bacterium]